LEQLWSIELAGDSSCHRLAVFEHGCYMVHRSYIYRHKTLNLSHYVSQLSPS